MRNLNVTHKNESTRNRDRFGAASLGGDSIHSLRL